MTSRHKQADSLPKCNICDGPLGENFRYVPFLDSPGNPWKICIPCADKNDKYAISLRLKYVLILALLLVAIFAH